MRTKERKSVFSELIYDTLMGNTQYPQLDCDKVNDNFIEYNINSTTPDNGKIFILYGKTAFKITVERLKGRHENLTTVTQE